MCRSWLLFEPLSHGDLALLPRSALAIPSLHFVTSKGNAGALMVGSLGEVPWLQQSASELGAFGAGIAWPIVKAGNMELSPLEVFTAPGEKAQICHSLKISRCARSLTRCLPQWLVMVGIRTSGSWNRRASNCHCLERRPKEGQLQARSCAAIAVIAAVAVNIGCLPMAPSTRLRAAALGTSGVRGAEMVRSPES